VPAVVRRFEEHRLPELVVAAVARDPDVSHAATTSGRLSGRLAEARRPAHLRLAGPQLVTERTGFRLVLEQRSGHLNDHAPTSCHESMIIVTCTNDRCREPGPLPCHSSNGFGAPYSRAARSARFQPRKARQPSKHGQAAGDNSRIHLKSRQEPAHVRAGQPPGVRPRRY
jgi:hypothetical protein